MGDATMRLGRALVLLTAVACLLMLAACKKKPPVVNPTPPPTNTATVSSNPPRPPAPPEAVAEPTVVPAEPVPEDRIAAGSLDEINRNSPLNPVFFEYDSSDITPEGRAALDANASVLKKYASWAVTIEGHT